MSTSYQQPSATLSLKPLEGVMAGAVLAGSLGLALSPFTHAGLWIFVPSFMLMMVLAPSLLQLERSRGASILPIALIAVTLTTSGLLGVAVLSPKAGPDNNAIAAVDTTFPLPERLAVDIRKNGTEKALDDLQVMAAQDSAIASQSHQIAHAIGEYSLTRYPTAGDALAHCRSDFQSGCIHGVVEGYLSKTTDQNAFAGFCSQGQVKGSDFLRFNCLHGLGHAALSMSKYNLNQALGRCDLLGQEWDRSSCYGGVFMENVVTLWEGNDFLTTYKTDDHLYPCTGLAAQYQYQCYLMQSSFILLLNHYDFAEAFTECDGASAEFMPVCYQSLGREVSGYTLRSEPGSLKLCGLARPEMRANCIVGAAKNFVDFYGRIPEGVALCATTESQSQETCYYAIGEEVGVLFPDATQRTAECRRIDQRYLDACLRGARVKQ
jgi:hypothetical protein